MSYNFDSKYANVLTIVLVIVILAILGLVGYFGFTVLMGKKVDKDAQEALDEFNRKTTNRISNTVGKKDNTTEDTNSVDMKDVLGMLDDGSENDDSSIDSTDSVQTNAGREKVYLSGYEIMGSIKIPKTGIEYPVLKEVTKDSLEASVAILYGVGLNQPGNTTILGHNLRNGKFFSNNKKLSEGDQIIIKDNSGTSITYIIYDMYETDPSDAEYMLRDTQGYREISLSTCTDDSSARLIVLAREQI